MAKTKTPPAESELANEPTTASTPDTVDAESRIIPAKSSQITNLGDVGALMEADATDAAGHGFEKGDVAIPFLRVLQSNSPQVKRQNPAYIDGAVEGSFYNTVTQAVMDGDTGIFFVPVVFQRQATLWWPRETGGPKGEKGFVRQLPIAEAEQMLKTNTEKNEKGKDVVKEGPHKGQELVFAAMYYGFVADEKGYFEPVAFPLTFTQIKKARMWNALIMGARLTNSSGVGSYNPRMFGFAYKLTTGPESNAKGEWSGVKITRDRPLLEYRAKEKDGPLVPTEVFPGGAQLYMAAREFETLMASGNVKVKHEDMTGGETDTGAGAGTTEEDDKLPF